MIGWQPRKGEGVWHVSVDHTPEVSLCGVRVARVDRYVRRDPFKVDDYKGVRCVSCWREWKLMIAASHAVQDQAEARRAM